MGLQAAGRRKEWGAREVDVGKMGLVGCCLRKSKTAGVPLWTLPVAALISMSKYHLYLFGDPELFSRSAHRLRQIFFLGHLEGTRRYILIRVRGSSGTRGASYPRLKPLKLALFAGYHFREQQLKNRRLLNGCRV